MKGILWFSRSSSSSIRLLNPFRSIEWCLKNKIDSMCKLEDVSQIKRSIVQRHNKGTLKISSAFHSSRIWWLFFLGTARLENINGLSISSIKGHLDLNTRLSFANKSAA